ncbi:MAG: type III pantothenate kinase [Clostridia bacterium]|nr:type III pantothenate kinase [Clostridia bacterium]
MLLAYNIGNDSIQLGFFEGDELCGTVSVSNDTNRTSDEYACIFKGLLDFNGLAPSAFEGAIGSSVVPTMTETVRSALEKLLGFRPHVLGVGTKTGLNILTDDPTQLGSDLVAAAVGALSKYTPPLILIDLGTAATFSVLDKNGAFMGCVIAPGVTLSAEALSNGTSLLPHFARTEPKKCIGTNTMESMQSGCIYGSVAMLDGMITRIEGEIGENAVVIASGKDAPDIVPLCAHNIKSDDTLLLLGLKEIYKKNMRKRK